MDMHNRLTQLITKIPLFLLIWIIAYCPNSAAQSSGTQSRREKVQRILREFQDKSGFPGAIAGVYFADGSSLVVAVGYADRDTKKQMRESDLLHAGSVGKTFFAALALQLIAQRRISLDDLIAQYLGRESWFRQLPNASAITVRMLMNHTSGLPSYGNEFMQGVAQSPSKEHSPLEGIKSILNAKPLYPAGTKFSYSDINYLVLGFIIEQITGKRAYDEIKKRLLMPLKLRRIIPADQGRGLDVTSVDVSVKAVQVMSQRGCRNAKVGDIFDFYSEPFETILVILNIGIVGDLDGLVRFLKHLDALMTDDGQLITDSVDPRNPEDESYRKYTQTNIAKGRYLGERRLRIEYKGQISDWFEWMHIDPEIFERYIHKAGYYLEHLGKDGKRHLVSIRKREYDAGRGALLCHA